MAFPTWATVELYNVILLGMVFMLLFTSFHATAFTSKNVMESMTAQTNGSYQGDAYLSSSIIYITLSLSNWIAPVVLSIIGVKFSMFTGAIPYCLYVASFIYPMEWSLYTTSVLIGLGASLVWCSQGTMLAECSEDTTMTRNTGIFWLLFQSSFIIGNLIEFVLLKGLSDFDAATRTTLFSILTAIGILGTILILLFKKWPKMADPHKVSINEFEDTLRKMWSTLKNSFILFQTKGMLLLSFTTFYSGLSNAFRGVIFPACVGQNLNFEEPKAMIGVVGFTVGIAEVLGSLLMMVFGQKIVRNGREPLVIFSFILHTAAYSLSYFNFPDNCPGGESTGHVVIRTEAVAIISAFLLGFGDAFLVNAIFSLVGKMYSGTSFTSPAFALCSFVQSLAAAIAFFYASINLKYQLIILLVFNALSILTFVAIELQCIPKVAEIRARLKKSCSHLQYLNTEKSSANQSTGL